MEPTMTRSADSRIELVDALGRVIGTIVRPLERQPLGPGREKVYLARRAPQREARSSHAA